MNRYIEALQNQPRNPRQLACPRCDDAPQRFTDDDLWNHVIAEHDPQLDSKDTDKKRHVLDEAHLKTKQLDATHVGGVPSELSLQVAPGSETLRIKDLSLSEPQFSSSGKRRARSDIEEQSAERSHGSRRTKSSPRQTRPLGHQMYSPGLAPGSVTFPGQHVQNTTFPFSSTARYGSRDGLRVLLDTKYPGLILQPESTPISAKQLDVEVTLILAGLVMVEQKCKKVYHDYQKQKQNQKEETKLGDDKLQALIALFKTLLHEHHDFLLASQHPSASNELKCKAETEEMPRRMWKNGIEPFLAMLQDKLPERREHMLTFLYSAYQMMALLYETVPIFEDIWIENLGDLCRYRMSIEKQGSHDREIWIEVARFWYTKAARKNPHVGRLYHHLSILARANALQQLYLYSRSLTSAQPYSKARGSIAMLFDQVVAEPSSDISLTWEAHYFRAHIAIFSRGSLETFKSNVSEYLRQLDPHIGRVTAKWKEQGIYVAIANIASVFDYGSAESDLWKAYRSYDDNFHPQKHGKEHTQSRITSKRSSYNNVRLATHLLLPTLSLNLRRIGDNNVLTHLYLIFSFLLSLFSVQSVDSTRTYVGTYILEEVPWEEVAFFLTTLFKIGKVDDRFERQDFLQLEKGSGEEHLLPEDHHARGQLWYQWSLPQDFFGDSAKDGDSRSLELPSTVKTRIERVLHRGVQLAMVCFKCLVSRILYLTHLGGSMDAI
ncbi:hypothetical protein M501DRAFT_979324 [Patellaria atrata CBS 101060]|uniref:DNA/RNA-binding domain-containing protein n=1 Tax=Patellaria atrata CBS 101060 TaxID=1346257 RepID=A0A9P4S627_9PEZI|nr:hypothetical protein M501DRAFT_979324 [Patellaria atrata CBS 101060]